MTSPSEPHIKINLKDFGPREELAFLKGIIEGSVLNKTARVTKSRFRLSFSQDATAAVFFRYATENVGLSLSMEKVLHRNNENKIVLTLKKSAVINSLIKHFYGNWETFEAKIMINRQNRSQIDTYIKTFVKTNFPH